MVKHVVALGQNAMSLTDHESLSGHVNFIKTIKQLKKDEKIPQDFKPILGNEIYLVDEDEMNIEVKNGVSNFYHFILIAKDTKGHQQLRELSSRAWNRMFSYKGVDRVPTFYSDIEEVIGDDIGHLIASSACLGGYIPKNVLKILSDDCLDIQEYKRNIHNFINWCIDIFGKDDFYIELQPSHMIEQVEYNKYVLNIAKAYGLKHIITTDAHYLKKEDRLIHKAYLTSDEDEGGGNREIDDFYSSTYFFTVDELLENMNYLDESIIIKGIENTVEVANKVEIYDLANKQVIPKVKLPNKKDWFYDEALNKLCKQYEYINKMIISNEVYDNFLISLIQKGIKEKISVEEYQDVLERVDIECKEILGISKAKEEPVSSYFITMVKNIDIIWEEANAIVAPGRGSAGGFIINDLIGITQINPLKQGIEMPHWRFISAERPDYPDIDIDVPSHKRDIVFQCLSNYYQSIGGTIVRVCTFGTETAKSTILTACRGLNINNDIALYLSSLIPVERGKVWSIEDCYYGDEQKNRKPISEFKNLIDEHEDKGLLNVALGIQGLINKRSSHACFDENTLITTHDGLKKIKDIKIGDRVLTHNNKFKTVVKTMENETSEIYFLKVKSAFPVEVTGEHPFYVRERTDIGRKKIFSEPKWKSVVELNKGKDYLGIAINTESIIPDYNYFNLPFNDANFWWIIGRYLGDGWTEYYRRNKKGRNEWEEKRIIICCTKKNKNELNEICNILKLLDFKFRYEESRTTYKIFIDNNYLYEYVQKYGKYADGKYLNNDIFNLPNNLLKSFLDGYISADGSYNQKYNKYILKTVSKELAIGLIQVVNKVYKRHVGVTILPAKQEIIEGRIVNSKEKYEIYFTINVRPKEKSFYENGYIWTPICKLTNNKINKKVYNLSVVDDNSYVANGLIVHNCGVLIVNDAITNKNALMRTPGGELVSQFSLEDSEYVGNIKYDLLNTKTCAMIQVTLEMLIEHGNIKWQGSLRETYNKYLHPDVIDRETLEMWNLLDKGELISAFQFDSPVGEQALKAIKPVNLLEATNANNLMRLMVEDGAEQPLEMYVRYKQDINQWYQDMKTFGLQEHEIKIMEKHLLKDYGVCSTQEGMMLLTMDNNVADFNVVDSNLARKGVAKFLAS
jgi:hypothetical protein